MSLVFSVSFIACFFLFFFCSDFDFVCRYSSGVRVGRSGAEGTEWVSETSIVCKAAAGVEGSLSVVATSGVLTGSWTSGVSYDGSVVSGSVGVNVRSSGGLSTTVIGGGFGTRR